MASSNSIILLSFKKALAIDNLCFSPPDNLIPFSPISVLYYEKYDSLDKLKKYLDANQDKLQCIVSNNLVKNSTKFGMTQSPSLQEFADNVNTVDFLLKVN